MKIKQLLIVGLLLLGAEFASAIPLANANFVFTLPGTLTSTTGGSYQSTSNFSFSIRLNYPGPTPANILSLSYFFEVPAAYAPFITITSQSISDGSSGSPSSFNQNLAPTSDFPLAFNTAADSGRLRANGPGSGGDLGGSSGSAIAPTAGSYFISTITFHLAGAPAGSFALQTTLSPPTSVADSSSTEYALPQATYNITVVPEPSSWSLMLCGGLAAAGIFALRRRRCS